MSEDPDQTIYPKVLPSDAVDPIAQAVARFDRVLAGEDPGDLKNMELPGKLDAQAAELVGFLALVEHAWPRDGFSDSPRRDPADSADRVEHETPTSSAQPTLSESSTRIDSQAAMGLMADRVRYEELATESEGHRLPMCLGRFRLLKVLGQGGYGIVYLAEDPIARRLVALKLPRPDILLTRDVQRRFLREARLAAALDHPNIVRVYEVGEIGPLCYIASEYCQGMNLAAWLSERLEAMDQQLAAEAVAILADAVGHAHSRGVLHRDIKPSNVLMVHSGTHTDFAGEQLAKQSLDIPGPQTSQWAQGKSLRPKLCDFGLAKMENSQAKDSILTRSGEMLGTPSYMSPEQVTAKSVITEAADIYGLGVILYELLTGRAPFVGDTHVDIFRQVVEERPKDPRHLQKWVAHDLVAICLKCLEKEPTNRYGSAVALAEDLRRFLGGEEVAAKLPSLSQRLLAWTHRHSRLAFVTATSLVVFIVSVLAIQTINAGRLAKINQDLDDKQSELEQTNSALLATNDHLTRAQYRLREHLYMADMQNASSAFEEHDLRTVRHLLDSQIPGENEPDLRRMHWQLLSSLADPHLSTVLGRHESQCEMVRVTKDGRYAYSASQDGTILGFDLKSGERVASWKYDAQIDTLSLSDDGRYLLTGLTIFGAPTQSILIVDLETGEEERRIRAHGYPICASAFSPDGRWIATAGRNSDDAIMVHSVEGETVTMFKSNLGRTSLEFSSDGRSLVSIAKVEGGQVLRTASLKNANQFHDSSSFTAIYSFSVSQQASLIAAAVAARDGGDPVIAIMPLNSEDKHFHSTLRCRGNMSCIALSPNGDYLAAGTDDGRVMIWNVRDVLQGVVEATWPRVVFQDSGIRSIAFIPGSEKTHFLTSAANGSVTRWDLNERYPQALKLVNIGPSAKQSDPSGSLDAPVLGIIDLVPDPSQVGKYIALTTDGRLVRMEIGKNATGSFSSICQTKAGNSGKIAVSGTELAIAVLEPKTICIVSLMTGDVIKRLGAPITSQACQSLVFQNQKLYANYKNMLWSLNLEDMKIDVKAIAPRVNAIGASCLLPIPNSSTLLFMSCRKTLSIVDGQLSELKISYDCNTEDRVARFSQDGKWLAIGDRNGQISLLDVEQNYLMINRFQVHHQSPQDIYFVDDDRTIMSIGGGTQEIRFIDVATQKLIGRIPIRFGENGIRWLPEVGGVLCLCHDASYLLNYD